MTYSGTEKPIDYNELTETQVGLNKQRIAEYIKERKKGFDDLYQSNYYFTPEDDYVRLVDYYKNHYSKEIQEELRGIAHSRIQRETVVHILRAIRQLNQILRSGLTRKYKQEILDSDEINNLIIELLEQGEFSTKENINRYEFAEKLFNSSMKILIDEAPEPIKKYLVEHINKFYDMASIPTELSVEQKRKLIRPRVTVGKIRGDVKVKLGTEFKEKKPKTETSENSETA